MDLKNKNIIVTGASSGIGQAVAIACAQKGAHICIVYRSNAKGAEKTLSEVEKYSTGSVYQANLINNEEVERVISTIFKDVEHIDILINNAGEADMGSMEDISMWKKQWESILMTAVLTTNVFLKEKSTQVRKIINISSLYGEAYSGNPDLIQYSAAKAAMHNWSMNIAKELAPHILVNCVAPGWTKTPAWEGTPQERLQACEERTPIGRFITSEEVAHTVIFLAENDAMTGEILHIDGGVRLVPLV